MVRSPSCELGKGAAHDGSRRSDGRSGGVAARSARFKLGPDGHVTGAIPQFRAMGSSRPARIRRTKVDGVRSDGIIAARLFMGPLGREANSAKDFEAQLRRKSPDRGVELRGETIPRRNGAVTRSSLTRPHATTASASQDLTRFGRVCKRCSRRRALRAPGRRGMHPRLACIKSSFHRWRTGCQKRKLNNCALSSTAKSNV